VRFYIFRERVRLPKQIGKEKESGVSNPINLCRREGGGGGPSLSNCSCARKKRKKGTKEKKGKYALSFLGGTDFLVRKEREGDRKIQAKKKGREKRILSSRKKIGGGEHFFNDKKIKIHASFGGGEGKKGEHWLYLAGKRGRGRKRKSAGEGSGPLNIIPDKRVRGEEGKGDGPFKRKKNGVEIWGEKDPPFFSVVDEGEKKGLRRLSAKKKRREKTRDGLKAFSSLRRLSRRKKK